MHARDRRRNRGHDETGIAAVAPAEDVDAVEVQLVEEGVHVLCEEVVGRRAVVFAGLALPAGIDGDDPVMLGQREYLFVELYDRARVAVE